MPTYVALRYLAGTVASDESSSFAPAIVQRRYPVHPLAGHRLSRQFKGVDAGGQPEYRTIFMPSPTCWLAESYVLSELSREGSFAKGGDVYSYLWPDKPDATTNYKPYYEGYSARNESIRAALRKMPAAVALSIDLKSYYPSIDQEDVRSKFASRLSASQASPDVRAMSMKLVDHALACSGTGVGVPVGPDISHLLGDLALGELDDDLGRDFRGRYFRYVDDIVLLLAPSELQSGLERIRNHITDKGLRINDEKLDVVGRDEWLVSGPTGRTRIEEKTFPALIFKIKTFLATRPELVGELEKELRDAGVFLPLKRYQGHAGKRGWRDRLTQLNLDGWSVLLSAKRETPRSLGLYAKEVRLNLHRNIQAVVRKEVPPNGLVRKWHLQQLRKLANQSLYIGTDEDLAAVLQAIHPFPELMETYCVLLSITTGDADPLLAMPGSAISAYASVVECRYLEVRPIVLGTSASEEELVSLGTMMLYGVPGAMMPPSGSLTKDQDTFLRFCSGRAPGSREMFDFSYLDELRTLQISEASMSSREILATSFADEEEPVLEALLLGESNSPGAGRGWR